MLRMEPTVKIFVGILLAAAFCKAQDSSLCSEDNRTNDLKSCLEKIRERFVDPDVWWFGSSYTTNCPPEKALTIPCYSNRDTQGNDLASTFFTTVTFNENELDRYIDVTYISEPGEYSGCGVPYASNKITTIIVDPLSNDVTIEPWDARDMPEISYESKSNKQYTIIIQDGASAAIHGLIVNIDGDDVTTGDVAVPYRGPLNFRDIPNPLIFLLFEQTVKDIDTPTVADPTSAFNTSAFVTDNALKGPIGLTWVAVGYDLYAAEKVRAAGWIDNCSPFFTEGLKNEDLPFIPDSVTTDPLPGFVSVNITTDEPLTFTFCCQENTVPAGTVQVNPFRPTPLSPAVVRTGSAVSVSLVQNRLDLDNEEDDFTGQQFAVIAVDPDIPPQFSFAGTRTLPILHYMTTNNEVTDSGILTGGTSVHILHGPMPPDLEPRTHRYFFLVFKQSAPIIGDSSAYAGPDCVERLTGRCLFNVTHFVSANNLELYGATWMRAQNDDYTNLQWRVNQSVTCVGRPGYADPCP